MAVAFATVLVEFSAICILLNGTLRALEAIWKKNQHNLYIYNSIDFLKIFTWLRALISNLYIVLQFFKSSYWFLERIRMATSFAIIYIFALNHVTDRNLLYYGFRPTL